MSSTAVKHSSKMTGDACCVSGREVLGRKLSVIKTSKKEAVWVKGAVKEFDEPTIRHKARHVPMHCVLSTQVVIWVCNDRTDVSGNWMESHHPCQTVNF